MSTDLTFITNEENVSLLNRFNVLVKDCKAFDVLVGYVEAVETTAPGILAAKSIAEGSLPLDVPDFRSGPHRELRKMPAGM